MVSEDKRWTIGESVILFVLVAMVLAFLVGIVGAGCYVVPKYRVYSQEKAGEAELARAEHNRQIKVEEARANLESSKFYAQAEVERARGVAEANEIIGDSLRDNEQYLRYLWINGLHDGKNEVIYIPTEANLPIIEAGRYLKEPLPAE